MKGIYLMPNAWLHYNSTTMEPIGVSWKQLDSPSVEIDDDLAIKFIEGYELFLNWKISVNDTGGITLSKIEDENNTLPFWEISPINDVNTGCLMSADSNYVYIHLANGMPAVHILYQTQHEQPSWLIQSYDLLDYEINNNTIIIDIEQAYQFSYFLG
jgi:hypothetical protein